MISSSSSSQSTHSYPSGIMLKFWVRAHAKSSRHSPRSTRIGAQPGPPGFSFRCSRSSGVPSVDPVS
jgi:hypothetical protein